MDMDAVFQEIYSTDESAFDRLPPDFPRIRWPVERLPGQSDEAFSHRRAYALFEMCAKSKIAGSVMRMTTYLGRHKTCRETACRRAGRCCRLRPLDRTQHGRCFAMLMPRCIDESEFESWRVALYRGLKARADAAGLS